MHMMARSRRRAGILAAVPLLVWLIWGDTAFAAVNTEQIAERIAQSLINLRGKGSIYKTVAFSQIRQARRSDVDVGEIIDTTDHASGRNPFYAPSAK